MKISVIIPVYNAAQWLDKCLQSILNQTYNNLEIICIDDASTDNSYEILKKYSMLDARIKLCKNEKNLHVANVRNIGMNISTGEYIHFMDADDFLELNTYQNLVEIIRSHNCQIDILNFQYRKLSYDGKKVLFEYEHCQKEQLNKEINVTIDPSLICSYRATNGTMLYRSQFLIKNNCFYKDYPSCEDVFFCYLTLLQAKSIIIIDDIYYNYRFNNPVSVGAKRYSNIASNLELFYELVELRQFCNYANFEYLAKASYNFIITILLGAYDRKLIAYNDLVFICREIYDNVLFKFFPNSCWYYIVNELVNKSYIYFKFKYLIRKLFPNFVKIYLYLKKRF